MPEDRRAALSRLRRPCRAEHEGFDEVMAYGMPAYERGRGRGDRLRASEAVHLVHLVRSDVREAFDERLSRQDVGKGCLRFRKPGSIDFDLVRDLLKATAASPGEIC